MSKIISKQELWNLQKEQISELTLGKCIRIVFKNSEFKDVCIKNLLVAANPPYHFIGFLTIDGERINLLDIESLII